MISRRVITNLVAFFVVSFALVAYGILSLLHNPFDSQINIATLFPNTAGLRPGFTVSENGVVVGSVKSVSLDGSGVKVVMAIDHGKSIPGDVAADVVRANPLGEQAIDLVPQHGGTAPPLQTGATVPVGPQGAPPDVGQVIDVADKLLAAIPTGDLNTVIHNLALGFAGRADDFRALISASSTFAQEFLSYQDQFKALLANSPPLLDTLSNAGPQLVQALANTQVLTKVLADQRYNLVDLLNNGGKLGDLLGTIVANERPNVACLLHDVAGVDANLSQAPNLANLNATLATNQYFFGTVDKIAPYGPTKSLGPGSVAQTHQTELRVRVILPPATPAASSYTTPTPPRQAQLGAGCQTEFGAGVGPTTQANPSPEPVSPGALPDKAAPASTAQVRGSGAGAPPLDAAPASFVAVDGASAWMVVILAGLILAGLLRLRPSRERFMAAQGLATKTRGRRWRRHGSQRRKRI
ncbi:MAG: MCE family protein [Acidimicrobiales bacterium]